MRKIIIDCEVYKNYFLFSAKELGKEKIITVELFNDTIIGTNERSIASKIMASCATISFNGLGYDLPIIAYFLQGKQNIDIFKLSSLIVGSKGSSWDIFKKIGLRVPDWDHVDVMNVAPGIASLKMYGARMFADLIQDLPYDPDSIISETHRLELLNYCGNDLKLTENLYNSLNDQIKLREEIGSRYGIDLRSKSDAQIAEAVFKEEYLKVTGDKLVAKKLPAKDFKYIDPGFIKFQTKNLQELFEIIRGTTFEVNSAGKVTLPSEISNFNLEIGGLKYTVGIGGLHSVEKKRAIDVSKNEDVCLFDFDVTSYYPSTILQQKLAPKSIGNKFHSLYELFYKERLLAKSEGDKVRSDTLKILLNGTYGKLGSIYSIFYAPDLMIQTTITGQLALLMLIERLGLADIRCVSANTDGVTVLIPSILMPWAENVMFEWELDTSYNLERTEYLKIASRDVSNYIAVTKNGVKKKGIFGNPNIAKNPDMPIVFKAVVDFFAKGIPIEKTIRQCNDIFQFCKIRKVTGGAEWRGQLIGKTTRYYYSVDIPLEESIAYQLNGNRVPDSGGARPCQSRPSKFPRDVDFDRYIDLAKKLIEEIGINESKNID